MVKLTETLFRKFSAYIVYAGEEFGYAEDNEIPSGSIPLFCDIVSLIHGSVYHINISYAYFVHISDFSSKKYDSLYFFINSTVYKVKSSLLSTFTCDEIVVFLYLTFEKHQLFNI